MKLLLLSFALLLQGKAFAFSGNSLTWQKLALEEKVQRKYANALSPILKENQYLVDIEVEVSEPGQPNLGNDNEFKGTRVSDLKLEESRGDYIAFSKMGLEVPVVEKFLDEDRTKLMNLYKFNETYDLFKNISGVKVTVFLSDKLPEDLSEIAKKVVNNTRLAVADLKPSVKFETMAMEWIDPAIEKAKQEALKPKPEAKKTPKEEKEPKIWTKDWYEWASRWGNAVGLILGSIIIGVIAIVLFKQWKSFMEAYTAQMKNDSKSDNKDVNENTGDAGASAVMSADSAQVQQEDDVQSKHGLERFQQCLAQHPEEAINIVRAWLNESDDTAILNLRAVALQSNREEMEILLNGLMTDQRDKWKSYLGTHLEPSDLVLANKNIFQDVVRTLLVPSKIKDGDLLNLIMELTPSRTCEFLNQNKTFIGTMMNVLSPNTVSRVLAQVSDDDVETWLAEGTIFQEKEMDEKLGALKDALVSFKEATAPSPFAQRLASMIPSASPTREGSLYRALLKSGGVTMVTEVAKKNFPYELVMKLPVSILRETFQSLPMAKRIDVISSRDEEAKSFLLNALAEPNTPARDMMDMELENLKNDPARMAQISSGSEDIWQEFVKVTRLLLSKNASYTNTASELVNEWGQALPTGLRAIDGGKAA